MNRRRETVKDNAVRTIRLCLIGIVSVPFGSASSADFRERSFSPYGRELNRQEPLVEIEPAPRYFPRAEGDSTPPRYEDRRRRIACIPRRVPIPTDAPDDPSYVGSAYGLGKPNYYGIKPALGVDDPFGRSLLPYCN